MSSRTANASVKSPQSHDEISPPTELYVIYQALLSTQGDYVSRLKDVQKAAAQYDTTRPESGKALEVEFSRLINKPVRLSAVQLACFKEILVDNPAFAHIAPWIHPDCVW
ncbi:hypothetical protein [Hyalangium versicolor]|uniref:hypothetical protein n=1 Tax=Hyalangium versicolor TaxID=2861190 RepID=UPI001CCFEF74|nr:hypothetical protein [Hyalangium versicolor]